MFYYLVLFLVSLGILIASPIKSINYENLTYLSKDIANDISGISIEEELDNSKVDKAILNFYKQGYFEDIYATFENSTLTFHFKERPSVVSLEVNGFGSKNEKDALYEQLDLKKGKTFDQAKLDSSIDLIKRIMEYKGYYGTVVESQVTKVGEGNAVVIVLDVNRGDSITINKSHYFGANNIPKSVIESATSNKEREFMGWLWWRNDGKLILGELEADQVRIKDLYMERGFIEATVSKPLLKVNLNKNTAELYYNIDEGEQYKVSEIDFDIDTKEVDTEELKKKLSLKSGSVLNVRLMKSDLGVIQTSLADIGHAFSVVAPDIIKDADNKTAKLVYKAISGKKVTINDVIVTGNTATSDRIIRREVSISPGDMYSTTSIRSSENSLRRLGYFEKVEISTKKIGDELIDLIVNVSEGRTGELNFSIGYGSFYGLTISTNLNERNLLGSGFGLGLMSDVSFGGSVKSKNESNAIESKGKVDSSLLRPSKQAFSLSISNPRMLDSKWGLSLNTYYSDSLSYDYRESYVGAGVTLGRLITDSLKIGVSYDISRNNTYAFTDPRYAKYFKSESDGSGGIKGIWSRGYFGKDAPIKSSITPSITFDNTDEYYFPRNGVSASASIQFLGIGGDVKYVKMYARASSYLDVTKLIGLDLIARYKIQGGYLIRGKKQDYMPLSDTFYAGGVGSIRGFGSYSISASDEYGLRIGGDGMFANSVELSYGIFPNAKMRISLFADYGFLTYKSNNKMVDLRYFGLLKGVENKFSIRGSLGASIEWISPMGPMVLVFPFYWYDGKDMFSYKVAEDKTNKDFQPKFFDLTMGTRF